MSPVSTSDTPCFLVRPYRDRVSRYDALGAAKTPESVMAFQAGRRRDLGELEAVCPVAPLPAGFNPYFDLPAA